MKKTGMMKDTEIRCRGIKAINKTLGPAVASDFLTCSAENMPVI